MSSWATLCSDSPELAAAITGRFEANVRDVLGTIRADGSVRLSGTGVTIDQDHAGVGMMPDSFTLLDPAGRRDGVLSCRVRRVSSDRYRFPRRTLDSNSCWSIRMFRTTVPGV